MYCQKQVLNPVKCPLHALCLLAYDLSLSVASGVCQSQIAAARAYKLSQVPYFLEFFPRVLLILVRARMRAGTRPFSVPRCELSFAPGAPPTSCEFYYCAGTI